MRPRSSSCEEVQGDLLRVELSFLVDAEHALVKLAHEVDWAFFERELSEVFDERTGAPAKPVRLMVGLHYLKHVYNLSDEQTVARWVENPYWQYFCGMKWFEHAMPIDPSSMTRWRKLIGERGAEAMLAQSIATGLKMQAVRESSFEQVNVDTTVQEKAIAFPTDAKLYSAMRRQLVDLAKEHGVALRQSYRRKGRQALIMVGRYGRARQGKRRARETRKLKTYLGRVTRDIVRKIASNDALKTAFAEPICLANRLLAQKRNDKNKLYSIHAPEVECIAKGKAHKHYEFGCKVSLVATSREGFILGAQALHDNPYDGHTLHTALKQAESLVGRDLTGNVFVDLGYRGHNYQGQAVVHVGDRKRRGVPKRLLRWIKRRAAIEPLIGHMKSDGRLGRNYLLGKLGDKLNAILSACGQNLRLMLNHLSAKARKRLLCALVQWLDASICGSASAPQTQGQSYALAA